MGVVGVDVCTKSVDQEHIAENYCKLVKQRMIFRRNCLHRATNTTVQMFVDLTCYVPTNVSVLFRPRTDGV